MVFHKSADYGAAPKPPKEFLFVDDDKDRHITFAKLCRDLNVHITHVHTVHDAICALRDCSAFDCVWLDRDAHGNGVDEHFEEVVDYLITHLPTNQRPKNIVVHSANIPRAIEMTRALFLAGYNAKRCMFLD